MRGREFGPASSHTQAAPHYTTPQQQFSPQPRPARNTSDGMINRPSNEMPTSSNETKVILHVQQTASGKVGKLDETQRSVHLQPTPELSEPAASSEACNEPSLPPLHVETRTTPTPSSTSTETEQILSGSTPLDNIEKCESPDATNFSKDYNKSSENKWTFQLTKFPAPNPKNLPQNLLFVVDSETNVVFLIDSGSEISILPKELTNGVNKYFLPQSRAIQGFGNKTTHPIGSVDVELHLGGLEPIHHSFWVTQETRSFGIIGMDLLIKNQLAIFPSTFQLRGISSDRSAKLYAPVDLPDPIIASVNHINISENTVPLEERCKRLLREFPEITRKPTYHTKPKHNYALEIILDDYKPTMVKARRPGGRRAAIQEHFDDLLHRGVVTRGDATEGASPVTCVQKKDNSMRVCVDYTLLNKATRPLSYPLPRIDELAQIIPGGTKYFTNLDLKEAYYSLPLAANSRKCAAIIAHTGVFIPNRCVFGLKNAPMKFQQVMETLLRECNAFTYVYLDDILIYSFTEEEHVYHVKKVFETLSKYGLFLNVKKTTFAKAKLEFLGHVIGVEGIDVQASKVAAIRKYPLPITRKDLKRFMGMVNYYHAFVDGLAEILAPLSAISGGPKKTNRTILKLDDSHIRAFEDTKAALANAATLSFEDQSKPLILFSDASDTHTGASLEQVNDKGEMVPLAFFSRSIPENKRVRCTYYKELAGLVMSIKHFHSRIYGRQLIIRSDNLALCNALKKELTDQTPYVQRYLQRVQEYNPTIIHVKGADNVVADALSRPPQATMMYMGRYETDPDYEEMWYSDSEDEVSENEPTEIEEEVITPERIDRNSVALLQQSEPDLIETAQTLKKAIEFSKPENVAEIVEVGNKRTILPESLRLPAFNAAHQVLHLGIEKSIDAVAKDFWWPTLKADVTHWVKTCLQCQAIKVIRHNRPKIGFFPEATTRFNFVHIDLIGPMNVVSNNCRYVLTMKDRGTGFLVTAPIPDKKAITVRNAFVQSWCSYFGSPKVVISDNGGEFANQLLSEAFVQLGVDHRFVPPYSPQSNGFIERQHRSINQALRAEKTKTNWALRLPMITATINNTSIEGSPYTPSQYALGVCANLPGQIFADKRVEKEEFEYNQSDTRLFLNIMSNISRKHRRHQEKNEYYEPSLFQCEKVWVKRTNKKKLSTLYHGPYKVLHASEHSMFIQKNSGVVKVSIRNVKACYPREEMEESKNDDIPVNKYNLRERKKIINWDKVINYEEGSNSDEN